MLEDLQPSVRFVLSVIIALIFIAFVGRMLFDFDESPENDPCDLIGGIGVWTAAVLVAVLNEMIIYRRRKAGPQ